MVLEDVTELYGYLSLLLLDPTNNLSDYTGNHTKLSKILLNGNNICMVRDLSTYSLCMEAKALTS